MTDGQYALRIQQVTRTVVVNSIPAPMADAFKATPESIRLGAYLETMTVISSSWSFTTRTQLGLFARRSAPKNPYQQIDVSKHCTPYGGDSLE
jgi:hypothetical protein